MSEYGVYYSQYGSADDLKESFLGFVAVNDFSDISFAGVTSQLQLFGIIGISSTADIIDMARNGFLDQPTTNKEMSDKKTGKFHDFPEELQITAIMCALQEDPATRQSNTNAMDRQRNAKQDIYNMVNWSLLEKATDKFIQCLIYRQMWESDRPWKTAGEVKK